MAGRSSALTIFTAVSRPWSWWLRFNWWRLAIAGRIRHRLGRDKPTPAVRVLMTLSFVSFAHWYVLDRVPPAGAHSGRRLKHPYLLFVSNFNGDARQYFEAFSRTLTLPMRALWAGAYGVPPPLPAGPFAEYIIANQLANDHYYCAYPEGSTKMILDGLELRRRIDRFTAVAAALEPEEFAARCREFMGEVQKLC